MRLRARREIWPTISFMRSIAGSVVADHLVDFVGEEIAHGALDQIGLLEDAAGAGFSLHRLLDVAPLLEEKARDRARNSAPAGLRRRCE